MPIVPAPPPRPLALDDVDRAVLLRALLADLPEPGRSALDVEVRALLREGYREAGARVPGWLREG